MCDKSVLSSGQKQPPAAVQTAKLEQTYGPRLVTASHTSSCAIATAGIISDDTAIQELGKNHTNNDAVCCQSLGASCMAGTQHTGWTLHQHPQSCGLLLNCLLPCFAGDEVGHLPHLCMQRQQQQQQRVMWDHAGMVSTCEAGKHNHRAAQLVTGRSAPLDASCDQPTITVTEAVTSTSAIDCVSRDAGPAHLQLVVI